MNVHVVLKLPLISEVHGANLAVEDCAAILWFFCAICVLVLVDFEAFLLGKCLEAVIATEQGSV